MERNLICLSLRWFAAALVLALVLAGCASKPPPTPEQQAQAYIAAYQAEIREIVPDPTRADQLVALTNEFQRMASDAIASVKSYEGQIAALNSDYEATRSDYEILVSGQRTNRQAFIKNALGLRERMVALTTDSEWEGLRKANDQAVGAYLR